ncbi:TPA: hypothetical protein JEW84_004478 [Escherichia coli]|nr:hypothetical protein [Escherichia coli]
MKLEDLPKYYSPKSPGLTDASASTSKDALSITDVMAAQGMTQNRAEMGFSAFLGKMGISMNDRERATELLTEYALSRCDRVAALRKLPAEIKPAEMLQQIISASSRPGDLVADFFMGSGSTVKAAMALGRRATGVELETERFEQTVREVQDLASQNG